ncbi:phage tail protein [Alteromonadaceae bacterium M269]|nr:phage tail protein [Alteromonadaceae bacterium M269]
MTAILQITRAGLDECVSASRKDIQVRIKEISVSPISFTPSADATALPNEIARVEIAEFIDLGESTLQMVGAFKGEEQFEIGSIGYWLESGTLLAIASKPGEILNFKPAGGAAIQPFTVDLSALPKDSVTVEVGQQNLNILTTKETALSTLAFVRSQIVQVEQAHTHMQLQERIRQIEEQQ